VKEQEIRRIVRKRYGQIAQSETSCCAAGSSCCGSSSVDQISRKIGYSRQDIGSVPQGADLGLGCGNPVALASIHEGDTVLDLGSGAGLDCFLAAAKVGETGRVIGVDMTAEMVEKARANAEKGGYDNVEFRLGEIEHLPVADSSITIIISNCVINLSPEKQQVFDEAFRVLKPGGRLMVSDIVLLNTLPESVKNSMEAYASCISGAELKDDYLNAIQQVGFCKVEVLGQSRFPLDLVASEPSTQLALDDLNLSVEQALELAQSIVSIQVSATKEA